MSIYVYYELYLTDKQKTENDFAWFQVREIYVTSFHFCRKQKFYESRLWVREKEGEKRN